MSPKHARPPPAPASPPGSGDELERVPSFMRGTYSRTLKALAMPPDAYRHSKPPPLSAMLPPTSTDHDGLPGRYESSAAASEAAARAAALHAAHVAFAESGYDDGDVGGGGSEVHTAPRYAAPPPQLPPAPTLPRAASRRAAAAEPVHSRLYRTPTASYAAFREAGGGHEVVGGPDGVWENALSKRIPTEAAGRAPPAFVSYVGATGIVPARNASRAPLLPPRDQGGQPAALASMSSMHLGRRPTAAAMGGPGMRGGGRLMSVPSAGELDIPGVQYVEEWDTDALPPPAYAAPARSTGSGSVVPQYAPLPAPASRRSLPLAVAAGFGSPPPPASQLASTSPAALSRAAHLRVLAAEAIARSDDYLDARDALAGLSPPPQPTPASGMEAGMAAAAAASSRRSTAAGTGIGTGAATARSNAGSSMEVGRAMSASRARGAVAPPRHVAPAPVPLAAASGRYPPPGAAREAALRTAASMRSIGKTVSLVDLAGIGFLDARSVSTRRAAYH